MPLRVLFFSLRCRKWQKVPFLVRSGGRGLKIYTVFTIAYRHYASGFANLRVCDFYEVISGVGTVTLSI